MKRFIFVCTNTLLAALICLSWTPAADAQGFVRPGRRAQWQSRVLQDVNPTVMTPQAAFGDQPLLAEQEWQLNPVPNQGGEIIEEGTVVTENGPSILNPTPTEQGLYPEQEMHSGQCGTQFNDCGTGYGCADCDCGNCGCNECGDCGSCGCECGSCHSCCGLLFPRALKPLLHRTEFFGGIHGFKGPVDQGSNGNFGFHGGFNLGGAIGGPYCNGYQLGLNIVGSDYSGTSILDSDAGDRKQLFFTGGIFHRDLNGGLQCGVAYDFLQDTYYFGRAHLGQVRGEISWGNCYREIGFWGAFQTRSDELSKTINDTLYNWNIKPISQYAFFYRHHFVEGAEARAWAGFTGNSDGLVGADLRIPLRESLALENSFNYLIPKQGRGTTGTTEESWGLVMNLVWYPGRKASSISCDPFRPLFNVANNNTFMSNMQIH